MSDEGYIAYECKECHLIFIIPLDGLRVADLLKRVIHCPLGHRRVEKLKIYDGLKECMEQTYSTLI